MARDLMGGVGGEPRDFDEWYLGAHRSLERTMWVMCGDRDLARDLCDEAFARALADWGRVGTMQSPGGWVRTVAVNLLRRRMRRRAMEARLIRRHRPEPVSPPEVTPELWAAVAALPDRQREAIALRYVADLTEAGVAEAMGISAGAASATLSVARRRLAEVLDPERSATDPMEETR